MYGGVRAIGDRAALRGHRSASLGGEQEKGLNPTGGLDFCSGFNRLANGNVVAANWLGHGKQGMGPHLVEFNVGNERVWEWADHAAARQVTNVLILE